ncbi:MAG: hypothetical protein ACF8NJ_00200 [Phycisphaerales bacterium JB038]
MDSEVAGQKMEQRLMSLPMETRDPFSTLEQRLQATIELCRYDKSPRLLLEWAIAQTGVEDPLSVYNRQELETIFMRWARERDTHLAKLLRELRRSNPAAADRVRGDLPDPVRQSLKKVHVRG